MAFPFWNAKIRILFPAQGEKRKSEILPRYEYRGESEPRGGKEQPCFHLSSAPLSPGGFTRPWRVLSFSHSTDTCKYARLWRHNLLFLLNLFPLKTMFCLTKETVSFFLLFYFCTWHFNHSDGVRVVSAMDTSLLENGKVLLAEERRIL